MLLRSRIASVVTPSRVAMAAWLFCTFVIGDRTAIAVVQALRGDRTYSCTYSVDCLRSNVTNVKCCSDTPDTSQHRTAVSRCQPACLVEPN